MKKEGKNKSFGITYIRFFTSTYDLSLRTQCFQHDGAKVNILRAILDFLQQALSTPFPDEPNSSVLRTL